MEEADLRLAETKKESYEFERDIVKGAMNPRTGKVIAEKVIRYLDEKNRSRVSVTLIGFEIIPVIYVHCFNLGHRLRLFVST